MNKNIQGDFQICISVPLSLALSHKPDYQHSGLNTYQFVSPFQWFKKGFRFDTAKKIKSLENSDDIADQITGRNDDYHNKHLMWW